MVNKLILKSPAKLNLYLDVLRKRPDGCHDLETVFEKIELFDIITIRPHKAGIKITTDSLKLPTDSRNLAYKAADLLFKEAGFEGGVWIDIKKNIPIEAGLGGGSSNAAITLLGLNRFFGFGLKKAQLVEYGRRLGADVPFFIYGSSLAIGRQRGDLIEPLNIAINIWHVIVTFDFGVATKEVFGRLNLRLTPPRTNAKMCVRFVRLIAENDIENIGASLYNSLEGVVLNKFKAIGEVKRLLLAEGAYGALMSGSGSTVFGITKTREEAIALRRRIRKGIGAACGVLVVKTANLEA